MPPMHATPFPGEARETTPPQAGGLTSSSPSMVSLALVSRLCSFLLASLHYLHLRTSPQLSKLVSVYLATLTLAD
jgi:hypothetical protein